MHAGGLQALAAEFAAVGFRAQHTTAADGRPALRVWPATVPSGAGVVLASVEHGLLTEWGCTIPAATARDYVLYLYGKSRQTGRSRP